MSCKQLFSVWVWLSVERQFQINQSERALRSKNYEQNKAWRAAISKQPIRIGFDGRDGNQNKAGAPTSIILKKMSQN